MSKSRKTNLGWYSPQALAEQANNGFLSIIRSTGKAVGYMTFGTIKGIGKVGRSLTGLKKKKNQPEPKAESPLNPDSQVPASSPVLNDAPSPSRAEASEHTESNAEATVKQKSTADNNLKTGEDKFPSIDLESLLKQYPSMNKVEAIELRNVLYNLLHGFETERLNAIKALIGLRRFAEPFLVTFLPTITSPQVTDIALEGLSQIDSPRLIDCIMQTFESPEPEMRLIALRAAHRLAEDQTQYFLERGLRDSNPKVKRRALTYLSWGKSSWALAEIKRLCDDPDPTVKWAALEALLNVDAPLAYDNLEQLMPSLSPSYQRRAAALLKQRYPRDIIND